MKRLIPILLLCLFFVACNESGNSGPPISEPSTSVAPDTSDDDSASIAPPSGVEKIIYHLGPIDLPPNTSVKDQALEPMILSFQVDEGKWLVGFEPHVIDGSGNELSSDLLHQVVVVNKHEENPLCPAAGVGNPFIAANSLLTKVEFPKGYAYPMLPTDPLEAQVILKNESDEAFSDVYLELVLFARPMDAMADFKDLKPVLVESDPCNHLPPDLPPGGLIEKEIEVAIPSSGSMVLAVGLLQNYGAELMLTRPKESEPIWRMRAEVDEEHNLVELMNNPFEDPAGIPINNGEDLKLRYSYENTTEGWLRSASAKALLFIAEE